MPITISYNDFITPTGSMSTEVSTPGSFSPIASNITDLDASDRTIIFTNLPNGLKVASTQDTPLPFDSIYVDFDGYADYVLMSGAGNLWGQTGSFLAKYMSDAGFWGIGGSQTSPGLSCTGAGGSEDSIVDITFQTINFQETTYTKADEDLNDLYIFRGRKYILDQAGDSLTKPVIFNQEDNYSWYPAEVVVPNGASVVISGISHSGNSSSVTLTPPFSGIVKWFDNTAQMILEADAMHNLFSPAPGEFGSFADEGYIEWNGTYANENFSVYSVLANNSGNTGTAVIQLNSSTIHGELFTDLIPPLRKVYVTFTDNP